MTPTLTIDVSVTAGEWSEQIHAVEAVCETAARATFAAANPPIGPAAVSILLADAAQSRDLNRAYRDCDKPTNVLAFAVLDAHCRLPGELMNETSFALPIGDVVLSYETCVEEAATEGKTLSNHLSHLVVHGMLHLLGYDHQMRADSEEMERIEIAVLASLDIPNPY